MKYGLIRLWGRVTMIPSVLHIGGQLLMVIAVMGLRQKYWEWLWQSKLINSLHILANHRHREGHLSIETWVELSRHIDRFGAELADRTMIRYNQR